MDAIELLESQHREVERLFKEAKKAEGAEKEGIFLMIADALAVHATIEEKIFYPAAMSDRTEDELQEAVQEHLQVKRLLADMLDLEPTDEKFTAKLTVLEEQVQHHVEEEEEELFKAVRREMKKERLEELGVEMQSMAEMLKDTEPAAELPNETDEAPSLQ